MRHGPASAPCRAGAAARLGWALVALAALVGPFAAPVVAQDGVALDARPLLLREDQAGRVDSPGNTLRLLLHAGNEAPSRVTVAFHGGAADGDTERRQSVGRWVLHEIAVPAGAAATVTPDGPAWVAITQGAIHEGPTFVLDCADVGTYVYWGAAATEVRVERSGEAAPVLRLYGPGPRPPVPDAPAVREHTLFPGPTETPFYFEVGLVGDRCAGTTTVTAVALADSAPLEHGLRTWLVPIVVTAIVLVGAAGVVWWSLRHRTRHRRLF